MVLLRRPSPPSRRPQTRLLLLQVARHQLLRLTPLPHRLLRLKRAMEMPAALRTLKLALTGVALRTMSAMRAIRNGKKSPGSSMVRLTAHASRGGIAVPTTLQAVALV